MIGQARQLITKNRISLHSLENTLNCGRLYLKLYMPCPEHNDMDVVVQIRKVSASGELLESLNWQPVPKPSIEAPNVNVTKHLGQK